MILESNCVYKQPLTPDFSSHVSILNQERISNGTQQSQVVNGATANASGVTSRIPGQWSSSDHIISPQYQAFGVRLASFARWPNDIIQRPEHLADAGFYYTGLEDVVRCFACDGGLKKWEPEDDPWTEHARWFPQCPFLRRVKGQEFIDLVRRMTEESDEEEDAVVHSTFQPNNPLTDAPNLRNELNPQLDQGKTEYTSTDKAEMILELGDKSHLPSGDQRETSYLPSPGPSEQITGSMVNENGCKIHANQIPSFEASDASLSTANSTNVRQYRNLTRNETSRIMLSIDMVRSEAVQLFGHERSQIFFDLLDTELFPFESAEAISEFVPNMAESTVRQNVMSVFEHEHVTMNKLMTLLLRYPDRKIFQQMPLQNFISQMKSLITSSLKATTK